MAVDRLLPTSEARDLLALVRDIADKELAPRVEEHERSATYPEGLFATLGAAGLRGRPAVRGIPAGVGGVGEPVGGRRGRGQRAGPGLPPGGRVRHAGAEGALA